jgi:hypothetical protein
VPARSDDHVGNQVGIVRRDVAQQERVPDAVDVDAQSHHAGVLAEVDSLDHQPHQVQSEVADIDVAGAVSVVRVPTGTGPTW